MSRPDPPEDRMPASSSAADILLVDDQEAIRRFLETTLERRGYQVRSAATGREGLALATDARPDLVLLDVRLPDGDGLDVLEELRTLHPDLRVIILTSYGRGEMAARARERGAVDFVTKPVDLERLLDLVQRHSTASRDGSPAPDEDLFRDLPDLVAARSEPMQALYAQVRKLSAGGRSTVLIQGESGVGKDVLAQLLHHHSPRRDYPFLEINCASLPEQLLESELFGHERGAFTDATQKKIGLLELAHSGTLFLDEIGDMPLAIQVKLLRVLEKMTFRRVGGLDPIEVDVRIVAATNRDLTARVREGRFREDLYFRLGVIQLTVPPLRERPEDVEGLANHFLAVYTEEFDKEFRGFTPDALERLRQQAWPGNVRQLRNTIERSVLLESGNRLAATGLHLDAAGDGLGVENEHPLAAEIRRILERPWPSDGIDLDALLGQLERELLRRALDACDGNQTRAARLLHLGRDRLRYRQKIHDL
ncbi:response regulator [bacterium]|nr:response regulator [bacterium]